MLRSVSSFLVLSFIFLQVAIAVSIKPGRYLIQNANGFFLGVGPVPRIFPPADVPVLLLDGGDPFVDEWDVQNANGNLVISARSRVGTYKLVAKDNYVFATTQKAAEPWTVTSVGDNKVEIKFPYKDLVFTAQDHEHPFVTLTPAQGKDIQKWTFIRVDRGLYSQDRFCGQETW